MSFSIIWSLDAEDELLEIVVFQKEKYGNSKALEVYQNLHDKVLVTKVQPEIGRIVPELSAIGMTLIQELIQSPWRILYIVNAEEVEIVSVVDGRRNFEEILYRKVMEGRLI